jgi:PBP1b-binding outer membrane lipoprotein LpoB
MHRTILALLAIILLFGCVSVPPSDYTKTYANPTTNPNAKQTQYDIEQNTGWQGISNLDPSKPTICTFTVNDKVKGTITVIMKMSGSQIRQEMSGLLNTTIIMRNNSAFVKSDDRDCQWIKFDLNSSQEKTAIADAGATDVLTAATKNNNVKPDVKCTNGNLGQTTFDTPGKVCLYTDVKNRLENLTG